MYIYIKGEIIEKKPDSVIVETGGIGYGLKIGSLTFDDLPSAGKKVKLHTYHYLREDREELYGFSKKGEKKLFEALIGVSNIGPSTAMDILSSIKPAHFVDYIINDNISGLSSVKGIGKKTAERLILELKDKIKEIEVPGTLKSRDITNRQEAVSGLKGLGYKESVARELIDAASDRIDDDDEPQVIIKKALRDEG